MSPIAGLAALVSIVAFTATDDPPAEEVVPCRWASTPPVLDGKLDDPVWEDAYVIDDFPAHWSGTPSDKSTTARLLWDDDAVYYAAAMSDKELRTHGEKRNDMLWNGDVFELFFKPKADAEPYNEFQVNPKGVILELPFPRRGHDFFELAALPPQGHEAEVIVAGTLDEPGDRDRGWAVEGRIPWSAFENSGGRPEPGAVWSFALCRYDYGPEGTEPKLMSSAPLTEPSFHRYEDYGKLRFEGPPSKP